MTYVRDRRDSFVRRHLGVTEATKVALRRDLRAMRYAAKVEIATQLAEVDTNA